MFFDWDPQEWTEVPLFFFFGGRGVLLGTPTKWTVVFLLFGGTSGYCPLHRIKSKRWPRFISLLIALFCGDLFALLSARRSVRSRTKMAAEVFGAQQPPCRWLKGEPKGLQAVWVFNSKLEIQMSGFCLSRGPQGCPESCL